MSVGVWILCRINYLKVVNSELNCSRQFPLIHAGESIVGEDIVEQLSQLNRIPERIK